MQTVASSLPARPRTWSGSARRSVPSRRGTITQTGKFVRYRRPDHRVRQYCHDDLETVCRTIRDKLIAGVEKRLDADAPVGFLLSGGLDSSLVCAISRPGAGQDAIRTFAIGMDKDAIDLKYARQVADYIGSGPHRGIS